MGASMSAGRWGENSTHRELNVSAAAALAARMTCLWYDEKRDGDELQYHYYQQHGVHSSSFQAADLVLPWTLEGYLAWERQHLQLHDHLYGKAWGRVITREIFDVARDFVHHCAVHSLYASYSY